MVVFVRCHRAVVAERHAPAAEPQNLRRTDVIGRQETEDARGDPRLDECLKHAHRRPRFLAAGLQQQRHFERNRRHPQRMHAGGVRRQHRPEHIRRRVERLHPARRGRVSFVERFDVQAAGQPGDDFLDIAKDVVNLACVSVAEHHRRTGRGREIFDVLVEGQFRIAARQRGVQEVIGGLLVHRQNVADWDR